MQTENDNGKQPAFPIVNSEGFPSSKGAIDLVNNSLCIGLTKREYFAAIALQGLIASNDEGAGDRLTELPQYAVQIADATLTELNK